MSNNEHHGPSSYVSACHLIVGTSIFLFFRSKSPSPKNIHELLDMYPGSSYAEAGASAVISNILCCTITNCGGLDIAGGINAAITEVT